VGIPAYYHASLCLYDTAWCFEPESQDGYRPMPVDSWVRTGYPLKGVACRLGSSIIKTAFPKSASGFELDPLTNMSMFPPPVIFATKPLGLPRVHT
jgi:hypothetical protein